MRTVRTMRMRIPLLPLRGPSTAFCAFRSNVDQSRIINASFPSVCFSSVPPRLQGEWLDENDGAYKIFTENRFVKSQPSTSTASTSTKVINPATQETLGNVLETTTEELDSLVAKSLEAYESTWRHVPVQQRQRIFLDYQKLIRDNLDEIAELITLENGKTLADSKGDVFRGLEVVETACQVAPLMLGDSLLGIGSNMDCVSYRVPLGVCAGICPFNFPAMIPLWMFPLAIACGNTYILKPSEKTPSAALKLASLVAEAGLPPNVLQVVHGGANLVTSLCEHPHIQALSFVGGNRAGEYIFKAGTESTGKRVQSNMGAKNHAIVMPDADPTSTIKAVVGAAFGAAGQRCMALSVVILVGSRDKVLNEWLPKICEAASQLQVGVGWDAATDVGPLITPASKDRVIHILSQAVQSGATLHLDGRHVTVPGYEKGNFIGPSVLSTNSTDNIAYSEEIFGPVLTCLTADSLEEAIQIINRNPYGNGCAIFTQSGAAARQFTADIAAGQVGINTPIPVPLPMFSFTGNKASIRGDVNFYGRSGVNFFTQLKTVTSNWPRQPKADLGGVTMPTIGGAVTK